MRTLVIIALLWSSSLFGQLATFEWDDEYDTFINLFLPLFENLEYIDCCDP